jgi:hypothetical protein
MENEERVYEKLEHMGKTIHETHVAVTEIKGDNKLQSEVLRFHIEQLKEFKTEIAKVIENQDRKFEQLVTRVDKLEKWQIRIVALASGAAAVIALITNELKEVFLR